MTGIPLGDQRLITVRGGAVEDSPACRSFFSRAASWAELLRLSHHVHKLFELFSVRVRPSVEAFPDQGAEEGGDESTSGLQASANLGEERREEEDDKNHRQDPPEGSPE